MRRIARTLLPCAAAAVAACTTAAPPPPSPLPARVSGATLVGQLDGATPLDVVVAMPLAASADAIARDGRLLSPAEFADAYAPPAAEYARVAAAFAARGLDVTTTPSRSTLTLHGRADLVAAALATTIDAYADGAGAFYAPRPLDPAVAQAMLIAGTAGLDDAGRWRSHRAPQPASASGAAEPADLVAMYDVPATAKGDGETVAILGTGYPPSDADVDGYAMKYSLPFARATQYVRVLLGGPNRDPSALAQNEYVENLLDADMVIALASHARVVHVITATNSPGLFSDGIVYIVNQHPEAHQVSVSYGTCERVAASEMLVMNQLFAQAKAEGQQWLFASGDNGTDGCRDGSGNHVLSIDWPASSPYVLGVGGTAINFGVEIAWAGGGGGQSEIWAKPSFQVAGPLGPPADGVRDVPDIAALAGSPGVTIYGQGQTIVGVQGTSCAAPMWAAFWALLDQARGGGGFRDGAERLYRLGALNASGLRDITAGTNGNGTTPGYPAKTGWDFATGWGVPDVARLLGQW